VNAAIGENAWMPIHYPDAFVDPDTGELVSDAEVAEIPVRGVRVQTEAATRPPAG
jgi:hypothetical protein